jgi:peptidoglycan biosynthesis protein MviN/MurJ (putative lipid II flippase)
LEVIRLKNEIIAGAVFGIIVGAIISVIVFFLLNVYILFMSTEKLLVLSATIAFWIGFVMISTLYYKLLRETILKEVAFFVGLIVIIGLMSCIYNILGYDILPYNSLQTHQIVALVIMGTSIGLGIRMIMEPKTIEKIKIAQ